MLHRFRSFVAIYAVLSMALVCNVYAQKQCYVVDSGDKRPVEFASIIASNGKGIYSNENGLFSIVCTASDTLWISRVGYEALRISCANVRDTVLMKPINTLKEVVVRPNKNKIETKWVGFSDYKSRSHFKNMSQVALFIRNDFGEPKTVNKLKFNFSKLRFYGSDRIKNVEIVIRLRIYGVDKKGSPAKDMLNDNIVAHLKKRQQYIVFDVENKAIEMPIEGFFIAVEFLGYANDHKYVTDSDNSEFKQRLQFTPAFSWGHSVAHSWYKKNQSSDWTKLFNSQSSQPNFHFGIEIQIN